MSRTIRTSIVAAAALFAATSSAGAQAPTTTAATQQHAPKLKDPTTARIIGIIPGAGHMYAGEVGRGFAYMGGVVGLAVVGGAVLLADCFNFTNDPCETPALPYIVVGATAGLWGWSIYDAGRAAERTNAKRAAQVATYVAPSLMPTREGRQVPGVAFGVTIMTR